MRYQIGIRKLAFVQQGVGVIVEEPVDEFICYEPVLSMASRSAVTASQNPSNDGLIISIVDTVGIGVVTFQAAKMSESLQGDLDAQIKAGFRKFEDLETELLKQREACSCPECSKLRTLLN